jgi:glycosyltransferase involved in cell wall biosynthesis
MQELKSKRLNILFIAEQCDPEGASVPLIAWHFFDQLSQLADVTLVTHERCQPQIERHRNGREVVYIQESNLSKRYYQLVMKLLTFLFRGRINWPLAHALVLPIYLEFDNAVYQKFKQAVEHHTYDVVHAVNPTIPRFPVKISQICTEVPFLFGPLNGGIPFPKNFQNKAKQEFAQFNFLRTLGRLIPGYAATYRQASRVLVGSNFTLEMLQKTFNLPDSRISLFSENGIPQEFFVEQKAVIPTDLVRLLFVGRLVPYKCADLVIEAIAKLDPATRAKVNLTIVGDGSERANLEAQVQSLHLEQSVKFTGWISHPETRSYYQTSDIFCFPSIREFGGAVVLEAMASGLPCIVANYGGISEYVTDETGFRIDPNSTEYLVQELTRNIQRLVEDDQLRSQMSQQAIQRAREFEWSHKAAQIMEVYGELVTEARANAQAVQSTPDLNRGVQYSS